MKVLILSPLYLPNRSGSAIHMAHLAEALARDGASVTVWTSDAQDTHYFVDRNMARVSCSEETLEGVRVRRFPLSSWSLHHPQMFNAIRGLVRPWTWWAFRDPATHTALLWHALVSAKRYDLVIAGVLPHTPFLLPGLVVARKWRAPLVFLTLIHTGEPMRVEYRQEFVGHGVPRLLCAADLVVCNSPAETGLLARRGIDQRKLVAIGPGADPGSCLGGDGGRFRRRYGIEGPIVLQMGTQTHEKGSHHTAEAVLWLRGQGIDATGVFLGFVRDDFDQGYLAYRTSHELKGLVVLGEVDDAIKRDALAAADILSMPSRADSFGISFLEGWLLGLPAIGAFAGGIPWVIEDGVDGFLVSFGDSFAAGGYMKVLLAQPELAMRMGERGRAKVWNRYTWDKVTQRFKEVVYPLLPRDPLG